MMRNYITSVLLVLLAGLALPSGIAGQEPDDCARGGNQYTRGAEVELTWAERKDDPVAEEVRYKRALEKLQPAFESDPDMPRAYLLAATAYLGLRDLSGADSMFKRLEELAPGCREYVSQLRFNAWVPWYNRGIAQMRDGDASAALEAFETANLIYGDARALTSAASLYHNQGETAKAIELYRRALEVGGDEEILRAATINLAELLRQEGRDEEALSMYEEYTVAHPDDVVGQLNYAVALVDAGNQESALQMFTELLERDDLTFSQWTQVGIGLYRAKEFGRATQAFRNAHEMSPLNKKVLENLANSYYQTEEYEALIPLADTLLQRYPGERINYNLLANAKRELGDANAALKILEQRDALPWEFLSLELVTLSEGVYALQGQVLNRNAEPGTDVMVPVQLLDENGETLLQDELGVTLPEHGEMAGVEFQVEVDGTVAGFRYTVPSTSA